VCGNDLVEGIVLRLKSGDYLQGELKIFDPRTTALVHCSFLGGVSFGEFVLVVDVLLLLGNCSRSFIS
jgi:hypothetical protein